jgi:hypothetical protein
MLTLKPLSPTAKIVPVEFNEQLIPKSVSFEPDAVIPLDAIGLVIARDGVCEKTPAVEVE